MKNADILVEVEAVAGKIDMLSVSAAAWGVNKISPEELLERVGGEAAVVAVVEVGAAERVLVGDAMVVEQRPPLAVAQQLVRLADFDELRLGRRIAVLVRMPESEAENGTSEQLSQRSNDG